MQQGKDKTKLPNIASGSTSFAPAFVGLGIGVLVGLSASPVVGSVIGTVLAMASAALAILVGWKRPEIGDLNMTPLAWFTICLVSGACLGVIAREQNIFGAGVWFGNNETTKEVETWVQLGIKREDAVKAIFAKQYPLNTDVRALRITDPAAELQKWVAAPLTDTVAANALLQFIYANTSESQTSTSNTYGDFSPPKTGLTLTGSVLWTSDQSACEDLLNEVDKGDINQALTRSVLSRWQALAVITDTLVLQNLISEDLCPLEQWSWES